ncbi:MAG TPA: zinc-dependent alcohol dehydrogenase family protein [Candidatus Aquilonibacter sp.]|nr:zinc-dependent alcohol dehydrogenase family protein [Candidatus Aquilonibacter sp.]
MLAVVRHANDGRGRLRIEETPMPQPAPHDVLLQVTACGVCRTDLHIVDAQLPAHQAAIIPGHQIVGRVRAAGSSVDPSMLGTRRGVSWIASTDGTCSHCRAQRENLCDAMQYTGYDRNGGYAQYAAARADFTYELPDALSDVDAAPLLCAGIIGFRALRVAGVERGERVGLFGFGASAHLAIQVLHAWKCEVYVCTRGDSHRALAQRMGAAWVGDERSAPPRPLDRAITFAPSGEVVIAALSSLRKGGVVAVNAIHLDRIPEFDYDRLLWGERQIRSVANMTRKDASDFLALAASAGIRSRVTDFSLREAARALESLRADRVDGAAVLIP